MRRITSKDVAREAGVSQTTVSFVLNGNVDQGISEKTRRRVLATAQRLGYVPSAAARSLTTGRSNVVLCVVPDFPVTQAMDEFKVELSRVLGQSDLACVYLHSAGVRQPLADMWQHVHPAVVVSFGELDQVDAETIRGAGIGLIDGLFSPEAGHFTGVEQARLGRIQVDYLASRGHRLIGYAVVRDPRESRFFTPRSEGAAAACADLGLPPPMLRVMDETPESGTDAVRAWRHAGITAVAAYNDMTALAIVNVCHRLGVAIPAELAVMGVDDLQLSALVSPSLTTIAMDLTAAAQTLAGQIVELLGDVDRGNPASPAAADHEMFRLVGRESA